MAALYIPGMRVEIRDAEWRIQRVDRCADGGYLLHCTGLSELVRGRSAQFMSRLEEQMGNAPRVLDPATTELVDDLSGGYRAGQLFIGTALRQTPPTDDRVYLGHEAATLYDQSGVSSLPLAQASSLSPPVRTKPCLTNRATTLSSTAKPATTSRSSNPTANATTVWCGRRWINRCHTTL